jgi:transcriptional regulator of acetoin/glycerol metabolism
VRVEKACAAASSKHPAGRKISRNTLYRKIKRHGIPIAHRSDGIVGI